MTLLCVGNSPRSAGVTLVEMMVTLAVAAILAAVAVPSFRNVLNNSQLSSFVNSTLADMTLARSEAIKRARPVSVCGSADQQQCDGRWLDGRLVFLDENSDGDFDAGDDEILRRTDVTSGSLVVKSRWHFTYFARGTTNTPGTMVVCSTNASVDNRSLIVSSMGRARVVQSSHDATACE